MMLFNLYINEKLTIKEGGERDEFISLVAT